MRRTAAISGAALITATMLTACHENPECADLRDDIVLLDQRVPTLGEIGDRQTELIESFLRGEIGYDEIDSQFEDASASWSELRLLYRDYVELECDSDELQRRLEIERGMP